MEWIEKTLGELGDIVGGATPSTKHEEYYGGNIAWITPKDLSLLKGRYISYGERSITEAGLASCSAQMMPPNTVLFTSRAPIGYVAIARQSVCTNQGFKSVVPHECVDSLFLYYLLKFNKERIEAMGSGTTFKEVSGKTMKAVQVRIPCKIEDQKKIASILDSIDSKIENNAKINDNLDNLEHQASLLVGQYMESTNSRVPFSDIMSFDSGFAFRSSTYLPSGKYRIITIKNVQDGYIDSTGAAFIDNLPPKMKSSCLLDIGDALLSLTGNVGRVGVVCEENLLLNQRVAKIVPKDKALLPFSYFIFRQPGIKMQLISIAKGTAQLNLSPVETLNLMVPYEKESARPLSLTLTPLYQTIIMNTQENIVLASLRDALLPKLMSGEIDVSDVKL